MAKIKNRENIGGEKGNTAWCDASQHNGWYFLIAAQVFYSYTRAICQLAKPHVAIYSLFTTVLVSLSLEEKNLQRVVLLKTFPWQKPPALPLAGTNPPYRRLAKSMTEHHFVYHLSVESSLCKTLCKLSL